MFNTLMIRSYQSRVKVWAALCAVLGATSAMAQGRYEFSADGTEVTDKRANLVWMRCAEGMRWQGKSCQGQPVQVAYPLAVTRAADVASRSGKPWRLPTVKELTGLAKPGEADQSAGIPAIDPDAFPGTPMLRFWTSSSTGPHYYMYVGFKDGEAGENSRSVPAAIRLVREAK